MYTLNTVNAHCVSVDNMYTVTECMSDVVLQAAAQTPMVSPGYDSLFLDDEFYDTAQPTSARAAPSITAPFSGTLPSIIEQRSLEDIEYLPHFVALLRLRVLAIN